MKVNIRSQFSLGVQVILIALGFFITATTTGALQLVSARNPSLNPPAGGNGDSGLPIISPDGRYVLFASTANNLVLMSNSTPMTVLRPPVLNVFLRDRTNGTTTLASINLTGTGGGNGDSIPRGISTSGRYVLFESTASDLAAGVTNAGEVYVRDLTAKTTIWASTNARSLFQSVAGSTNEISCNQRISTNGQFVVFEACANAGANVVNGFYVRGMVLRYRLQTGLTDVIHTNANVPMAVPFKNIHSLDLTPDGRFVVFVANNNNSTAGTNTAIYLWDAQTGTNILVSADTNGFAAGSGISTEPAINGDGRYVVFSSMATNLVAGMPTTSRMYFAAICRPERRSWSVSAQTAAMETASPIHPPCNSVISR